MKDLSVATFLVTMIVIISQAFGDPGFVYPVAVLTTIAAFDWSNVGVPDVDNHTLKEAQ